MDKFDYKKVPAPKEGQTLTKLQIEAAKRGQLKAVEKRPATSASVPAAKREATKAAGTDNRKIKIINKECPHAAGSKRALQFTKMLSSKTVADYIQKGGKAKYIPRWVKDKRIVLE